jgi:beta-mannosidase
VAVIPALTDTAIGANTQLNVFINSDSNKIIAGKLSIKLLDFSGKILFAKEMDVLVPPLSNSIFYTIPVNDLLKGLNKEALVLSAALTVNSLTLSENLLYFNHPKFLQLQKPILKTNIIKQADGYAIELQANTLTKSVYLSLPNGDDHFSDNFFDLLPNQKVTIKLNSKLTINELKKQLIIRSLTDCEQ